MPTPTPDEWPAWFRAALASAPEHGRVEVDAATVTYRAWGEPAERGLVLVHGGGAHAAWWDHLGPLLATGRRVVALDLTGHGDSDRRGAYTLDIWAREVMAVADAGGIGGKPVIVGHSMGGSVTLRAAAMYGPGLAGAVLVDAAIRRHTPEQDAARAKRALGPPRVYRTRAEAVARFHPVPDQPTLPYIAAHIAETSVRAVDGGWSWKFDPRVFSRPMLSPDDLAPLSCRVAIVRAEHGRVSQQIGEDMRARLGGTEPVVEIPAAEHHVMLDQPLALVAAVRALLAGWEHSPPVSLVDSTV